MGSWWGAWGVPVFMVAGRKLHFWDCRKLRSQRNGHAKVVPFHSVDYSAIDEELPPPGAVPRRVDDCDPVLHRQKAISNLSLSPDGTRLLVGVTNGA